MEGTIVLLVSIVVMLLIMVRCLIKSVECFKQALDSLKEINETLEGIGCVGTSIDIRVRIRHIEMLKQMYNNALRNEEYENAIKLSKVIAREENELNDILDS